MKRYAVHAAIVALAAVLLLGSCDALFTNYFKAAGLGQVGTDRVAAVVDDPDDDNVIAALRVSITSDSFYASLAADSTLKTALEGRLVSIVTAAKSSVSGMTENVQIALNALVDIQIKTTRGMDIIRNLGKLMGPRATKAVSDPGSRDTTSDIESKITQLIPEGISEQDLADAVNGIAASWPYFVDMANIMKQSNPPRFVGMDRGQIWSTIQIAIMAALFEALDPAPGAGITIGEAFSKAWTAYNRDKDSFDPADFFVAPPNLEDLIKTQYFSTFDILIKAAGYDNVNDFVGVFGAE